MAYPALIQKILDLRQEMRDARNEQRILSEALVVIAEQNIRMSSRITALELGGEHTNPAPVSSTYYDPEGYDLLCGAKVAPLTIVNEGHPTHKGAAFTVVLNEISKT